MLTVRVPERVGHIAADVGGRAGGELRRLVAHGHLEPPIEDEEGLVEAGMDMKRRAREERRRGVLAHELARGRNLDDEPVPAGFDHLALARGEKHVAVSVRVHSDVSLVAVLTRTIVAPGAPKGKRRSV